MAVEILLNADPPSS